MSYDDWLEQPYRDMDRQAARLERHIDNCASCSHLEEHGHPEKCAECDHAWHLGLCGPSYCPCEGSGEPMTPEQVWAEQNRHAAEEDEAAYDRAMDQKLAEWKERER